MRWPSSSTSPAADPAAGIVSLLLLAAPATAMLRCDHIQVDGQKFNFRDLGGPHSVVTTQAQPEWEPYDYINTTYTLDLCAPLKKDGPVKESCPNGSRGVYPLSSLLSLSLLTRRCYHLSGAVG